MLTEEQQRAYDAAITASIDRAQQNLARARARNLNPQQRDLAARAEAFIAQAQQARRTDPAAAKSLAERAELLSREVGQ